MAMPWWGRYIGIPYVHGAADHSGCDCWGLVRIVLREQCGIELPAYGELSAGDLIAAARAIEDSKHDPWALVQGERKAFDVAVLWAHVNVDGQWLRDEDHVGVMVSATHLLHVEGSSAAVCVPLSHRSVRFRLLQTFRHKALA